MQPFLYTRSKCLSKYISNKAAISYISNANKGCYLNATHPDTPSKYLHILQIWMLPNATLCTKMDQECWLSDRWYIFYGAIRWLRIAFTRCPSHRGKTQNNHTDTVLCIWVRHCTSENYNNIVIGFGDFQYGRIWKIGATPDSHVIHSKKELKGHWIVSNRVHVCIAQLWHFVTLSIDA